MSPQQKIIVVIGGTGRVGGSVARSLHDNPEFHVKSTTRNPRSEKGQKLIADGIEVVKADSWSPSELDTALTGAWGVFLNTNSDDRDFQTRTGRPESDMGKTVIDAAKRQGVRHFVFAGLPDSEGISQGEVSILSFANKGAISDYGRRAGFDSFANVNVGWMMENFWNQSYEQAFGGFARVKDQDGFLTIRLFAMGNDPESTPWTAVRDDYGDIVHGVFLEPEKWNGQVIWAISDPISFQEVVDTYNRVTGTNVARYVRQVERVQAPTPEKTAEVNGVRDWSHHVKGNYCDGKPVDQSNAKLLKAAASKARKRHGRQLELQTFEGFIREHGIRGESM